MPPPMVTRAPEQRGKGRSWGRWRSGRADAAVLVGAVALVVAAAVEGRRLLAAGVDIFLGFPPLLASWAPHAGPGSLPALAVAVAVVVHGHRLAGRARWRPLLWASWATAVAWTTALALVDGWAVGLAGRLATDQEYLYDIPAVGSVAEMLRTFTDHMLTDQAQFWTTHVGAHPPGAFLVFVLLDRAGLGGGGPAGLLCVLVGASAVPAVAVTLRALDAEWAARAMLPFAVLSPAAVWVGVSADGLFAGVLAWAVALTALACRAEGRRADGLALAGGVLGGGTLYLSYGLVLGGLVVLAGPLATRRVRPLLVAGLGAGLVVAGFTAAGFDWVTGFELVRRLYADSIARSRPYGYFVWADLAALAIVLGPATLVALRRLWPRRPGTSGARGWRLGGALGDRAVPVLVGAALAAVLLADLSGLSKGEVERIWLPFAVWPVVACALLPVAGRRRWLAGQALLALAVNHLLLTVW